MSGPRNDRWTDERETRLKVLYAEGWSHSQIAQKLNEEFPQLARLTRNASLGKAHRLGIATGDRTPSRQVRRPPRLAMPKPPPGPVERDAPTEHDRDDLDLDILTWISRDSLKPAEIAKALGVTTTYVRTLVKESCEPEATGGAA